MFKVKIIRLKDIIICMIIIIVLFILGNFILKNIFLKNKVNFNVANLAKLSIDGESTIIRDISKENIEKKETKERKLNFIFKTGTNIFESEEINKNEVNQENVEVASDVDIEKDNSINSVTTEIVTPEPIKETYDKEYNGVKIKNETDYELADDTLNTSDLSINTNEIIIFHTHTCESYTTSDTYYYESTRKF